jgi:hypothetical protein
MKVESHHEPFGIADLRGSSASQSDHILPPVIGLDSNETYLILHLRTLGRLLVPQIGDFDLEFLMSRTIDDFFSWYSSQTGVSNISALRFSLMELESGPDKCVTVTQSDPEAFRTLKDVIKDTFLALIKENPNLSIFRVEVTLPDQRTDTVAVRSHRHVRWMKGNLIL